MVLDYGESVSVSEVSDEYDHITENPCPACGGRWKVRMQALLKDSEGRHYDRIDVICRRCRRRQAFLFDINSFFPRSKH
jgi:hypothetical protein